MILYCEVDGKEYVGRVVGLGNDSVVYMDDVLYLNNKIKSEDYLTKDKRIFWRRLLMQAISSDFY